MNELADLVSVINTKEPRLNKALVKTSPLFVYVRTGCHYSQDACHIIELEGFENTHVINIWYRPTPAYVTVGDFEKKVDIAVPDELLQTKEMSDLLARKDTVPQIYAYQDGQWQYVGGRDDLRNTQIVPPLTLSETGKTVAMGYSTRPSQLCNLKM